MKALPSTFGAAEYYSPVAEPHFRWFDSAEEAQRFSERPEFLSEEWRQLDLWCCCACIADLPVAVPIGQELVKEFQVGETLLAGTVNAGLDGLELHWSEARVEVAGLAPAGEPLGVDETRAILINYAQGKNMIVAEDQLLLTPDGTLRRACTLGLSDQLVSRDGMPVAINSLKTGTFEGPRYQLGTSTKLQNGLDGHLLCLNEVVVADYVLQAHQRDLPESVLSRS